MTRRRNRTTSLETADAPEHRWADGALDDASVAGYLLPARDLVKLRIDRSE